MSNRHLIISELMQMIIPKYVKATGNPFFAQGLTASQVEILLLLDEKGSQKINEIAKLLYMAKSNVSNICSRLEKAGYVKRKRQKEDQRVVKVELTEAAITVVGDLRERSDIVHAKMDQLISQQDFDAICEGLRKMSLLIDLFISEAEKVKMK